MIYNFDEIVERRNTNCLKYDFAAERGHRPDVLPLWVADMDFRTALPVRERLAALARYGVFGYSEGKESYFDAILSWFGKHYGWQPEREWLIETPGVVFALAMCVQAFTATGDGVLIQQPVYYPYSEVIRDNGRRIVNAPLQLRDGHYEIDFDDFEQKITSEKVKLFLLCSPHNPTCRVFTRDELLRMGKICAAHQVIVVSDEIHEDFIWPGRRFEVFQEVDPSFRDFTVTCTAPTKTFNLAGLQISNIFVPNPALRRKLRHAIDAAGYSQVTAFGLAGCEAAYRDGEEWYDQLMVYLKGNLDFFRSFLRERLPELRLIEPEGTYLLWVDMRGLGLSDAALADLIENRAGLWLDAGSVFGPDGSGFERFNIACPRATLRQALEQLERAVQSVRVGGAGAPVS